MKRETWRWRASLVALVFTITGCASMDGLRPRSTGVLEPGTLAASMSLAGVKADGNWPVQEWWKGFGDPQLDALETEALAGSPSLRLAQSRVDAARAKAVAAAGSLSPGADLNANASRQRFSGHDVIPPPWGGSFQSTAHASLDFSYEFDFWGRNRARLAAALSEEKATELERHEAALVLSVAVAKAYVELDRLEKRHAQLAAMVSLRREAARLTAQRAGAGLSLESESREALAGEASEKVELAAVEQSLLVVRHQLAGLVGAGPDRGLALTKPRLASAAERLALPSLIPADLVGRRADVRAGRLRVEAALGGEKAARAAFYPDINLAAFVGSQSLSFPYVFDAGSRILGVVGAVHLPVFESARLKSGLAGADAEVDAAIAGYDATVLGALRDVADRVADWRGLETQAAEQGRALAETEAGVQLTRKREGAGLASRLAVIAGELRLARERLAATDLAARRMQAAIELDRALGGGIA